MIEPKQILDALKIDFPVTNIYQYGSRVYGCNKPDSDFDFIIVTKALKLPSGGFRQNAISSQNRTFQGVLFSRSGFIDAINNYEMNVLECLFLQKEFIIQEDVNFKINRWYDAEMVKKVITKASNSFYLADCQAKDEEREMAKKGIFHALRILMFGLQLKEYGMIFNYGIANDLKSEIDAIDAEYFDTRKYMPLRDELIAELKK